MDEFKQLQSAVADGLALTPSPARPVDAAAGLRKLDFVRYYEHIADWILPHLKGRPVALVRGPGGVARIDSLPPRHDDHATRGLYRLPRELCAGHDDLVEIRSRQGLIAAAHLNVIAFHPWNSTTRTIDRPDRMVFDLDATDGVAAADLAAAARALRVLLQTVGLDSWVKTRDAKGLHVVVPTQPRWHSDAVRGLARAVALRLAAEAPDRIVATAAPKQRQGRVFVDDLRNAVGATTVAAYSARSRPGVGVSVPLAWHELDALADAFTWNLADVAERLATIGDPWADLSACRQSLGAAMKACVLPSSRR